jgi:hypothetical protein
LPWYDVLDRTTRVRANQGAIARRRPGEYILTGRLLVKSCSYFDKPVLSIVEGNSAERKNGKVFKPPSVPLGPVEGNEQSV